MYRMRFLLILATTFLSGCLGLQTPPPEAQGYWGKPTHYILQPQQEVPPQPAELNLLFFKYTWWPTNPVQFHSFAVSPLTVFTCDTLGCLHWYEGVKIDTTLALEYWKVYHGDPDRYVYEFKPSEQSAFGWHTLETTCTWTNMARC